MNKIWIIVAIAMIAVGALVFCGVMTSIKWDFRQLSTTEFSTTSYRIDQSFSNISLDVGETSVVLRPATDGKTSVVVFENKNALHTVAVEGDTLVITQDKKNTWHNVIGISFQSPEITLTLPPSEYRALTAKLSTGHMEILADFRFESIDIAASTGDVVCRASASEDIHIKLSTGDILLENVSAGSLALSATTGKINASGLTCDGELSIDVSTGKTYLADVTCGTLSSTGNTGDLSLQNVIATEKFLIERTTGNVTFDRCDAAEIVIATDTGYVTGTLLSDKIFSTQTSTGKISVPKSASGGACDITTSTGNIQISIS